MNKTLVLFFLIALSIFGCKKMTTSNNGDIDLAEGKIAPDDFNYSTTKKVDIRVRLLSRNDKPIPGVLVSIFNPSNVTAESAFTKVISDKDGYVITSINIPSYINTLVIDPAYIGLVRNAKVYIANNALIAVLGGSTGSSGNIVNEINNSTANVSKTIGAKTLSVVGKTSNNPTTIYQYNLNDYDNLGRPKNLLPVDNFDFVALMEQINNVLPEGKRTDQKYIATEAPTNLSITALADVWITFMHEGADYRNSLGYYTYPTGQAPKNAAEIDSVHLIFPNASLKHGRGQGAMLSGDKVKIGRFKAGTSIGFVLLQNTYNDGGSITPNSAKFYTDEALNPESNSIKRHTVLLHETSQKIFLIGFEDINRTAGYGSDQDFNDLVFYAQSNPVEAISPKDIPFLEEKVIDTDGDGVPDQNDKYPTDKNRAYDRYYPSENIWGTIAFEDMWPMEGDYDLNDLVVNYRYKFAMNADNKVVDLKAEYKPLAAGASFQNGLGIQLPLTNSEINNVTGFSLSRNSYIKLATNGLELGQPSPVFIPFDNYKNLFNHTNGFINTVPGKAKLNSTAVAVDILFTTPLADEFTSKAPFNPFMISNQIRGKEIHLVNQKPTALADLSLFGTYADDSKPLIGRYYLTKENKPFALDIFGEFLYPVEQKAIYDVYFNFAAWALSGGKTHLTWNENINERNDNFIYK